MQDSSSANFKPLAPHEASVDSTAAVETKTVRTFEMRILRNFWKYALIVASFFFSYAAIVLLAISNLCRWFSAWLEARAKGDTEPVEPVMTGLEEHGDLLRLCIGICVMFIVVVLLFWLL